MKTVSGDRIAAVVVLYSPEPDVVENIRSYLGELDRLYLVDNSPGRSDFVAGAFALESRVSYHPNHENLGVAVALNFAAARAVDEGFAFLLTMDQDSRAEPGMVRALHDCMSQGGEAAAMTVPFLDTGKGGVPPVARPVERIPVAMTSGSLLRLSAYLAAGRFRDDFFIDFVDVEYCLRLRKHGFDILRCNRALLRHSVGHRVGMKGFTVTSHIPVRSYYKTRNRMVVWRHYSGSFPGYCFRDRFRFLLEIVRVVCCEPAKIEKLGMIAKGFIDCGKGRMGRYER